MGRVISITSLKGGVGKTTTAHCLANALALEGYKVLAIDMDPQASFTLVSRIFERPPVTIADLLRRRAKNEGAIETEKAIIRAGRIDLIPSYIDLFTAEQEVSASFSREYVLRDVILPVRDQYDFIILDCSPNLNVTTYNALTAADEVIIPAKGEPLDVEGVRLLKVHAINLVQRNTNPQIRVRGIVLNMYQSRLIASREAKTELEKASEFGVPIFQTEIPRATVVAQWQAAKVEALSLYDYAPDSEITIAYKRFAKEVING